MKKISRRSFIHTGLAGFAGLTVAGQGSFNIDLRPEIKVDKVKLGNSGLTVSRIALGTGTIGGSKASNQTRLGMDKFAAMANHA
ncbi:MAG: aldo/keto reductase, partial [Dysgonamonadaceae bacterium]|nr:aldo/keto reductase [Dysgonamonadaceae bacterium]